jgi:RNA polymerase sigma-70 factor (ECF subfamily)
VIDGCIRGDLLVQKSFYYQYYATLMRICIRYAPTKEDAEQWVHDGFVKIFASLSSFGHQGSFEGWLKKIMVRLCIDKIRTLNTRKSEIDNTTVYDSDSVADVQYVHNDFVVKTDADDLLRIINLLPDKPKMVFNLIVFEDYTHKEVAALLQITENHSYLLLHQARQQLKTHFHNHVAKKDLKYEQK